jgi:uncharacterized delta-60 repeat protein
MWSLIRRNVRPANPARRTPFSFRPRLEALEDRCLLSAGAPDPTFGNGAGYVTTSLGKYGASASSVLIQPDGKILVGGSDYAGTKNAAPPQVFAVVRYNTDGSLDTSFGSGGIATADFPGALINGWRYSQSYASVLYPQAGTGNDGKIVLAGGHETKNSGSIFALARFNTNGTLDSTFGNAGEVTTSFPVSIPLQGGAHGVVIQSDGKIVAAGGSTSGFVLARYNSNGSLDTSFGSGGEVVTSLGANSNVSTLLLQPDGKLVVAGDTQPSGGDLWEVARYNANGSLDTSFGNGGIVSGTFGAGADLAGAALYSGSSANAGKILAVGSTSTGGGIARYNSDGSLDSTFGVGGEVALPDSKGGYPRTVALAADDKIVTTGPRNGSPGLERYNPDGSADNTFGVGGVARPVVTPGAAVTIESNGDIVVAGGSGTFAVARYLASQPQIGSFAATPNPVTAGSSVTVTASNITDANPNVTITQVAIYLDSNNDGTLEPGTDQLLGYATQTSPGVWTLTNSSVFGLTAGTYTLFAQAEDSDGVLGDPIALTLTVQ